MSAERCPCGRGDKRPGQRTCRDCHAADMRTRRAAAKARGTYTLRAPDEAARGRSPETRSTP